MRLRSIFDSASHCATTGAVFLKFAIAILPLLLVARDRGILLLERRLMAAATAAVFSGMAFGINESRLAGRGGMQLWGQMNLGEAIAVAALYPSCGKFWH